MKETGEAETTEIRRTVSEPGLAYYTLTQRKAMKLNNYHVTDGDSLDHLK